MAVEIPVYIDIAGGINQAVREIPKEVKKLEQVVGRNAIKLDFAIDTSGTKRSLQNLLTDTSLKTKELSYALSDIRKQFEAAMASNAGAKRVKAEVNNLIRAYTALEQRITGSNNRFTAAMMSTENAITRVKFQIQQLQAQQAKEAKYSDAWNKLGYQIRIQEEKLRGLNVQWETYRTKSRNAARTAQTSITGTNTALTAQYGLWQRLTGILSTYVSVFGLIRFAKQIRDVTGELEYQRVALGRLIQDEEYGAQLFERIKAAAIESPFRIKDLVTYTKQLAAYKIEQENLFDVTKRLADISAGLGVDMNRIILAYGQVRAASVLRGQELRQFTEAGIPLVELLAEKFSLLRNETVSTADVFKLISERAVPFSMIAEIFEDLTDKGGMFYDMQKKQAETLKGRWEKLKDAYDIALQRIGDTKTFQRLNNEILWLLNNIAKILVIVPKGLQAITYSLAAYVAIKKIKNLWDSKDIINSERIIRQQLYRAVASKKITLAEAAQTIQTQLLAKAEAKLAAATTFTGKAYAKMLMAIVSNPWIAAIAGVVGLVTMLVSFRKTAGEAASSAIDLDKSIDSFNQKAQEIGKTEKLINQYEKLANKTERTDKETRTLTTTFNKLQEIFPELTLSTENDTAAIEANTKAMHDNNEERLKGAKDRAEADLGLAKVQLDDYEKKRSELLEKYLGKRREMLLYDDESGERREMTKLEERAYAKATKEAEEYKAQLDDLDDKIAKTSKDIERYERLLGSNQKAIEGWKKTLEKMQLSASGVQLFTPEQLEEWHYLYDVSKDLEKEWKNLNEELNAFKASKDDVDPEFLDEWLDKIAILEDKISGMEYIRDFFGFKWGKEEKTTVSYQQDPFINTMQERMKFMEDFKKGYDDLSKYLTKEQALERQASIMQTRGLSLGIDIAQQRKAAEGLSDWYEEAINAAFEQAKKHGATGTVESFLSQVIDDKTNRGKALKDFQKLMQSLFDAATDFDTAQAKKNLENNLQELSDAVKRSETARNFYNNMLDLTGDEELSANLTFSVYGQEGKDFKERIQEQLLGALEAIDAKDIDNALLSKIKQDVTLFDTDAIKENIGKLPEEVRKLFTTALEESEQYNANWLIDFEKTYAKAASYEERVSRLEAQRTRAEQEAAKMGKSPEEVARVTEYYNRQIAQVQLEAMKDTYTWTKAFEDLDGVSTLTLNNLIELIDEYVTKYAKYLEPQQQKELTRAKEQAEAQKIQRNAYQAVGVAIGKLFNKTKAYEILQKNNFNLTKAFAELSDDQQKAIKDLADALSEAEREINEYISSAKDLMSVFATSDDASYFGEQLDNLSKAFSGVKSAGIGIAQLASGVITPQAIQQTASGVASIVSSIFGAANAAQARKVTKEIDYQNRLVEDLEESYDNLSRAMDKAFGNDYVYNYSQQLENLIAQQEAYQKQVDTLNEASSSAKTKKKKEEFREQAQEAEKEVRKVGTAIDDLKNTASSFFAGEDLSSAAESFADAWLSAYQEFGDTSQAIEERMTEMVQNIVKKAALSGIAESVLGGWYESLADVQDWNAQTIAEKWREAMALVDPMVQGMQTFANSMQAEGMSLRQLPGQFTGIKRDIAGASEESINGLAAGINTQNFYMSYISQNVAAILTYLTGGTTVPASTATGAASDPYKDTVLLNLASLPQMRDDLYEIRRLLSNVIKPTGTTATHYVATNL